MTAQEIIERLRVECRDGDKFAYDDNEFVCNNSKIVFEEGDCEGGGEYSEVVRYFEEYDVYIRLTGTYYSYNGTDWNNDYTEVVPKEKTIVVYEKI